MRYRVEVTEVAMRDAEHIYSYIAEHDSVEAAEPVFVGIQRVIETLDSLPERGHAPKELRDGDFREIHFRPYRIFYKVVVDRVSVIAIADGRRDMVRFLAHRLNR